MSAQKRRVAGRLGVGLALLLCARANAAQDAGFRGPSFDGANAFPSAAKAESKLWWNDGAWWGCLWSVSDQSFTIQRLDLGTHQWVDTHVALDRRPNTHADCKSNGAKLFVASHVYTSATGDSGDGIAFYRFGYDPTARRYALDTGFPVSIGDARCEVVTIDEDSHGRLWAAWTAHEHVWIAHSLADTRTWSLPSLHPRVSANLSGDDIAALVAFQGDKVGVLWSDQVSDSFRFSFRQDDDPEGTWSPVEIVGATPGIADDHVSLRASTDGRLFAALKTTTNLILLAEREAVGGWSGQVVASAADKWTRPTLVLDEDQRVVHVFGTSPAILGSIYEKTSPMDGLGFTPGIGRVVLRAGSGPALNDATTTKQALDGATGLVVLASDQLAEAYAYAHDDLGGPHAKPPVAAFGASETRGSLPLRVQFVDDSRGTPAQWAWTFGDGQTSSARNPLHVYTQAGQYTVELVVTNAQGADHRTRVAMIDVVAPPSSLVLRPVADGQVRQSAATLRYGDQPTMRVREDGDADYRSFLQFRVLPQVQRIGAATLRLTCVDGSPDGGALYAVADEWTEPHLSWANAPAIAGVPVVQLGTVAASSTLAVDLGALVTASGTLSLGLVSASSNSAYYWTREGDAPPELELGLAPWSGPPAAGFEAAGRTGTAPSAVQFFDASGGPVNTWAWDFGDGTSSTLQNPSHAYADPGSYAVSLRVTGPSGTHTVVANEFVHVLPGGRGRLGHAAPPDPNVQLPFTGSSPPHARERLAELVPLLAERGEISRFVAGENGGIPVLDFEFAGEPRDVLAGFTDALAATGLELVALAPFARGGGANDAFVLGLRGGSVAWLTLRPGSPGHVRAELTLGFD